MTRCPLCHHLMRRTLVGHWVCRHEPCRVARIRASQRKYEHRTRLARRREEPTGTADIPAERIEAIIASAERRIAWERQHGLRPAVDAWAQRSSRPAPPDAE